MTLYMLGMKKQSGLTLVELMVTLAVALILILLGVPAYDRMMANNRVSGQTNVFVTALTSARSEALGRGLPVAVCAKASNDPADTDCGSAANWTNGWQVFLDTGATAGDFDAGIETRLQVFNAPEGTPQIAASTATIRYLADGTLDTGVNAASVSFRVGQGVSGSYSNCMRVTLVGSLSTERKEEGDSCP